MKEQNLKSIIKAVKLNIARIHLFLLPYIAIGLLFFIIVKLDTLFKFAYSYLLLVLIILVYAAVIRHYVSELVLGIEK